MLSSLPRPVIIAHRGASAHAPENTVAAFQLAVEQGIKAIELDVQLTADQQVVVFHDLVLDRTTNGTGLLSNFNLSDLQQLEAGLAFDPLYPNTIIPSLIEVITALPEDVFFNIELKNLPQPFDVLPRITAQIIKQFNIHDRVLISSFNPIALKLFHSHLPEIPLGRLFHSPLVIACCHLLPFHLERYQSVHLPFNSLSEKRIRRFQQRNLMVFTYTVNRPQDILQAIDYGVDGIFTDDPALAKKISTRSKPSKTTTV